MGAEIDRLEVQIEAEATKANSQLDSLAKKLGIVQESLSRLNSGGLTGLSSGVRDFGSAMQSFSSVKAADFTKVANGLTKLGKVPSGSLWNTAYAIGGVAKNLSSLKGVSFDATGLNDLAKALSKLGSKNGTAGAENLRKIKDDLASFVSGMNGVGSVTFDVTGLADLTASIAKLGGEKATQAARNLPAMSVYLKKFVADLNSVGGVTFDLQGLSELVSSIAKLGGKASTQSIKNIPNLAAAISELMATLSQAPTVSKNTIQMVAALGELSAQGAKVGSAAKSVNQSLNSMGNSATGAAKKTKSLASVIGSLYANLFWIKRIAGKVWESMESSMDFLETVNYFEVAMRDIGDSAAAQWKENGYASAEAYASSFSERAKELTEKMTGYSIDVDGNATYSGIKNLGMDPDTVLQYQATFAQVSSSIGVAEESALNFSKALTMLGADWASLRNLTFEEGWEKFASALAGQSRAVRALGIDITNTTLQEYAYKYGLDQAIQEMNQATKAQLRLLAILDQSEVAYGDLANTIESPSNQLRMLQQNVSNLSRVFGNLFLPVLQRTLPYINGVTIALQNLFSWMGNLLGIEFDSINSSMGGMSDEMYDLLDDAEDYEDALKGANDAAKKLKNNLQSWHEINNITTNDDSDSGSGTGGSVSGGSALLDSAIADALADYEKVWNEAFENMENKAQEYAEKIEQYLEPLKKVIEDFTIGDYFQAGQDTSALVAGIFNFFADAIDDVDWYGIGQNIGDYLAGIDWTKVLGSVGHLVWEALKASLELWVGAFSTAPLETALITLGVMPKALKAITTSKFITGVSKLASNFKTLGKNLSGYLQNLDATGQVLTFNSGIETIRNNMTGLQKGLVGVVAVAGEFLLLKDGFYDIAKGSDNLVASIGQIAVGAGMASGALYVAFGPAGLAVAAITGVAAAIMGIKDAMDDITEELVNSVVFDGIGTSISTIADNVANLINTTGTSSETMSKFADDIASIQSDIDNASQSVEEYRLTLEKTGALSEEEIGGMKTSVQELATALDKELKYNTDIAFQTFMNMSKETAEQLGIDVGTMTEILSQFQNRFAGIYDDMQAEADVYMDKMLAGTATEGDIAALNALLDDMEYLSADAIKRQIELENSIKEMLDIDFGSVDETTAAIENIKETGLAKMGELDAYYEELTGQVTVWQEEVKRALEIGRITDSEASSYYNWLDALSTAYNNNWDSEKAEIENQINTTYDYIKSQLELKGTEVYEAAENRDRGILELVFSPHKDTKAINKFTEDIYNPIISALNNAKKGINPEAESVGTEMWENFSHWVKEADLSTNDLHDTAVQNLKGYEKGIEENSDIAKDAMIKVFGDGVVAVKEDVFDQHSPSKVFEEIGLNNVLGFNKGIIENAPKTIDIMESYMSAVVHTFNGITGTFTKIGQNLMAGFLDGMSSMEDSLYAKANNIADNIVQTVQNALDIHSPSRVMFALGEYTMEGYQLGLENLYSSVEKSMGGFYHDLQYYYDLQNNPPQISNYTYAIPAAEYSSHSYETQETIMLLRELVNSNRDLLTATRAGHVIEYNGRELGRVVQDEAMDYYKRNHVGMFDHR